MSLADQLNGVTFHRRVVGIFWVSTVFRVFMFFLCVRPPLYIFLEFFFCSLLWKSKKTQLCVSFVATQGFPTRLTCYVTTKLPLLLCHALEKLLASKFSLSSTSAVLVLLPLGSFQHVHLTTELEAPIYMFWCISP